MKTLMKLLIAACLLANLFITPMAFASEFPPDSQPPRGVEGPDVPRG